MPRIVARASLDRKKRGQRCFPDILGIMLVLSQTLLNRPVMSLRTGGRVATTTSAIINPNNLKIEGFYCQDSVDKKLQLVLLYQDIRDILPAGIAINDHSVLAEAGDLVRLKATMDINFQLIGKSVVTVNKKNLGKISDFATDSATLFVQKLYVAQSLLKSFSGGNLSIDRTKIVEINSRKIVVEDPLEPVKAGRVATSPAPAS